MAEYEEKKNNFVYVDGSDIAPGDLEMHESNASSALLRLIEGTGALSSLKDILGKHYDLYFTFVYLLFNIVPISNDIINERITEFNNNFNPNCQVVPCCVCGTRIINHSYYQKSVSINEEYFEKFRLNNEEITTYNNTNIMIKECSITYKSDLGKFYKLNKDYIKNNHGYVCHLCYQNENIPRFSYYNHNNYGLWNYCTLGLKKLSLAESIMISRVHIHGRVLKIRCGKSNSDGSQSAITGHMIAFPHEKEKVIRDNKQFPLVNVADIIVIAIVGTSKQIIETIGDSTNDDRRNAFFHRTLIKDYLWVCTNFFQYTP